MTPIELSLPDGCEVYNYFYRTRDPNYLVQDILVVRLPSGFVIDVGWFPEHDVDGGYVILVVDKNDDEQHEIAAASADEVKQYVELLADRYSADTVYLTGSNEYVSTCTAF
jgi:hypothetical protein